MCFFLRPEQGPGHMVIIEEDCGFLSSGGDCLFPKPRSDLPYLYLSLSHSLPFSLHFHPLSSASHPWVKVNRGVWNQSMCNVCQCWTVNRFPMYKWRLSIPIIWYNDTVSTVDNKPIDTHGSPVQTVVCQSKCVGKKKQMEIWRCSLPFQNTHTDSL